MKFTSGSESLKVEVEIPNAVDLDEVFTAFINFLRATGYVIPYNQVIDLIEMDS